MQICVIHDCLALNEHMKVKMYSLSIKYECFISMYEPTWPSRRAFVAKSVPVVAYSYLPTIVRPRAIW
jgi:hypothetical protein